MNKDKSRIVNRVVASRSVVSRIWKKREDILLAYTSRSLTTKKVKKPLNSELDERLLSWFTEIRAKKKFLFPQRF